MSKPVKLAFTPSTAADVVGYEIELMDVEDEDSSVNFFLPVDEFEVLDTGELAFDLSAYEATKDLDGTYDIVVSAVDDADPPNVTDSDVLAGQTIDFLAPDAPTGLRLIR